ncbi:MAG: hypothetical protein V4624_00525 [Pseudomonadota bacterium]
MMKSSRRTCATMLFVATLATSALTGCNESSENKASDTNTPATPIESEKPVTQSQQPISGPGGSDYTNDDMRVSSGGTGDDAWFVFEPIDPQPKTAPLAIIMHGYFEFSGYDSMRALIEHTVRKGYVVIYPRWQTTPVTPCPGPANIEPCITSAVAGIRGALDYLKADSSRVQPELDRTSYFGFSFGGIVTANMLNRWESLELPKPRVMMLDDPHDGGYVGAREPALDHFLDGIPSTTLAFCHSGAHGVFDDTYAGLGGQLSDIGRQKTDGSCNQVFSRLTTIPDSRKSLVLTSEDNHGSPALTSDHGVCTSTPVDAYDWGFCWRAWDALRDCADTGQHCEYAFGDTSQNRYIGTWSDGVPIIGLKIQSQTPIRAEPTPARQRAPN